ncbi:hypothetical protein Q3G72_019357 [Acer saccharum]|nr:hypothetical protein Q3G72_019357 [Acer saccharum]
MGAAVWRVEDLKVKNCPIPFLELFSPSRLTALEIEACSGLTSLQTAMQSSTCLRRLKIEGCNSLEFIVLDGSSCQASRLEHLYISGCPSLRSLVEKDPDRSIFMEFFLLHSGSAFASYLHS